MNDVQKVDADCLWKVWGLGCCQCGDRELGCGLVGMQRKVEKVEKVEMNKQMTSEPGSNNMELMVELVEHIVKLQGAWNIWQREFGYW